STISQLGYMVMALGIGGFVAAIFHLLTHAFFKALLFLGSGSVIIGMERGHHLAAAAEHGAHTSHMAERESEAQRRHTAQPALGGSWSKDEILAHAFGQFMTSGALGLPLIAYLLGTAAAFLTAFYTARQIGLTFFGTPRHEASDAARESPPTMTLPLVVLALFT